MTARTPAEADLFAENFDNAVKNINLAKQVLKQDLFLVQPSNAAEEHFYQESTYDLTAGTIIPRDADFPAVS